MRPLTPSLAALVLAGLTSEQGEPLGWNAALANATAAGGVGVALDADDGATVLHIAVPALRDYDISTAETISLLVPPAATLGGAVDLRANPSAVVRPAAAAVSGSLAANVGEAEVRASRQELRIDLTADRFAAGVGTDEAAGRALIGGISSTLAAYLYWTAVKRVDDTAVSIMLGGPGAAAWDIATPETVTVVLPASVVVGNASLVASPSFVIRAAPGTATMVPQQFLREEVYIAGNVKFEVRVDLADDAWVDGLADGTDAGDALAAALLSGFVSAQSEAAGWNAIVRAALTNASAEGVALRHGVAGGGLQRRSDQRVVVYIGDFGDYAISAPETISLVIPAIALRSGAPILAGSDRFSGPFVVSPSRGTATLTGNLLLDPYERDSVGRGRLAPHRPRRRHVAARSRLRGHRLDRRRVHGHADLGAARRGRRRVGLADGGAGGAAHAALAGDRPRVGVGAADRAASAARVQAVRRRDDHGVCPRRVPHSGKQMRPEQIGGIPFSVLPVAGRAYVSGSLLQEALETTVQSKGASLTVTLRDDEFVGDEADFVQKCISGSLKDEPGGWGAVVMEELRANPTQYIDIREVDAGYDIEVDIPASAGYSISEPETISVVIPAELLTSGQQIPASPSFVIEVSGATDVLAGASLAGGLSEADVIADRGPWYTTHNLTITLVNDTWLAARALVASRALVSAQAEAHGWNAIIRSSLSARLESDTALTLSFEGGEAAGDGYDISAPETVAVEVPAAACSSGQDVPIVPSFIIRAQSGRASMHPPARELTLLNASNELALVGPASHPLYLTLDGSEWTHDVGRERDATLAVLRSLVSEQAEAAGWNAIVRVGLEPRHVARIDDATLRLTVPQFGLYSISVPETIGVSLPPAAVSSASNLSSSASSSSRRAPAAPSSPAARCRASPPRRRCAPGRRPSRSSCSATRG